MYIILQFVLLVVGFVLLMKGADWFVDGASKIADKFGIPHLVIGLTIVAFGTSAPEAAVSISAALKGSIPALLKRAFAVAFLPHQHTVFISWIVSAIAISRSLPGKRLF